MKRKAALFDFDGTLSSGHISMKFLNFLHSKGIYSDYFYTEQMRIFSLNKEGKLSYEKWVEDWGLLWADGLKGKDKADISKVAKVLFEEVKNDIYPQSKELIALMSENTYHPIMISAGAYEVVSLAAKELGIADIYSTKLEIKNGVYTGNIESSMHLSGAKSMVLKELSSRYNYKNSFAFGDSISDAEMLIEVGNPIALNPSEKLVTLAKEHCWNISTIETVLNDVKKMISINNKSTN